MHEKDTATVAMWCHLIMSTIEFRPQMSGCVYLHISIMKDICYSIILTTHLSSAEWPVQIWLVGEYSFDLDHITNLPQGTDLCSSTPVDKAFGYDSYDNMAQISPCFFPQINTMMILRRLVVNPRTAQVVQVPQSQNRKKVSDSCVSC